MVRRIKILLLLYAILCNTTYKFCVTGWLSLLTLAFGIKGRLSILKIGPELEYSILFYFLCVTKIARIYFFENISIINALCILHFFYFNSIFKYNTTIIHDSYHSYWGFRLYLRLSYLKWKIVDFKINIISTSVSVLRF